MASDNPTTQTHLEKEYQPQLEEIILRIKEIFTALGKINEKVDHIDKRLIVLEEQQKQVVGTKSLTTEINSASMKEINPVVPVKKTITENNQRSTCCICSIFGKTCTLYFDDLYDFNRKKINTEIGADALRFHCRCTHLIRDHARNPNSLETELPAFANPPLMQRLYEEAVPPLIQDWIWSYRKNKYNRLDQTDDGRKID